MKKNEFYLNKWNKYVVKVVDVTPFEVIMQTVSSGVTESILRENFNMNYELCKSIYEWRTTIEQVFDFATNIRFMGLGVKVTVDESWLEFSISPNTNMLSVQFSDDIKEAIESEYNIMDFLISDTDEIIRMFADLFE